MHHCPNYQKIYQTYRKRQFYFAQELQIDNLCQATLQNHCNSISQFYSFILRYNNCLPSNIGTYFLFVICVLIIQPSTLPPPISPKDSSHASRPFRISASPLIPYSPAKMEQPLIKISELIYQQEPSRAYIFIQQMSKKKLSKVIILGDSAVGKTSLLNAYVDQKFLQSYKATVGADFMEKQVIVDGKVINLEIWDTAGQQKFRSLGGAFYRGADCCVLVYDITNKRSFDNIETWITEFLNQGAPKEPEKFPFILIGNKIDREDEREVEDSSVQEFLSKHPKIKHLTTSAKNREGVEAAFEKIALASVENKQEEIFIPVEVPSNKLKNKKPEKKKGCC